MSHSYEFWKSSCQHSSAFYLFLQRIKTTSCILIDCLSVSIYFFFELIICDTMLFPIFSAYRDSVYRFSFYIHFIFRIDEWETWFYQIFCRVGKKISKLRKHWNSVHCEHVLEINCKLNVVRRSRRRQSKQTRKQYTLHFTCRHIKTAATTTKKNVTKKHTAKKQNAQLLTCLK